MKTKNQNSGKGKKVTKNLTNPSSALPNKVSEKTPLEKTLELFQIDLEIANVKNDLSNIEGEDMKEHRKILLDSLSILLKKRKNAIKEL